MRRVARWASSIGVGAGGEAGGVVIRLPCRAIVAESQPGDVEQEQIERPNWIKRSVSVKDMKRRYVGFRSLLVASVVETT
ncbi:hypothetical protein GCM10017620_04570 [Brevundimonas intermedia]|uniref:Uncharacterized protein n=1 Tax=Brevundimonas intermedia TaxID=74315 RepID=A0ABQ5T3Y9_9CAUL|nr:hypothetical protein GCM10017620_04570 [Brevundimonas intermedia]